LVRILVKWKGLSVGYFDAREILYAQHLVMTALALMVALFYAFVIVVGLFALRDNAWAPWMTAFSYLELGWLLIGIILAGLAFLFDGPITAMGLHVPTLVLVVIVIYGNSSLGNFYLLIEPTAPAGAPLSPAEVIDALFPAGNGKDTDRILTIVCASGGGIEASAWTARVLTSLDEEFPQSFANSIGLISSVSGGSVGAMYYLDHRYQPNAAALDPEDVVHEAEVPGLAAALWGLIGPDTFRWLSYSLPIRYSKIDRGWALEQVWRGAPKSLNRNQQAIDEKFSDWRNALRQGKLPAVVFNATNVYTGYPVLIGTTEIPKHVAKPDQSAPSTDTSAPPENVIQIGDGEGQYGNADIAVATAARLSASFPYVTPVATGFCSDGRQCPEAPNAKTPCAKTYLCDGGYYDNFGVWSAVNWLEAVLNDEQRRKRFKKIVILEIWSAPFDTPGNLPPVNQLIAPASAILNVRTASQLARNEAEIELLQSEHHDLIEHLIFEVPEPPPLSWMLSDCQKKQIDKDWINPKNTEVLKQMRNIFPSAPPRLANPKLDTSLSCFGR
jgi:predicted acylesterase/phospholipase RssA